MTNQWTSKLMSAVFGTIGTYLGGAFSAALAAWVAYSLGTFDRVASHYTVGQALGVIVVLFAVFAGALWAIRDYFRLRIYIYSAKDPNARYPHRSLNDVLWSAIETRIETQATRPIGTVEARLRKAEEELARTNDSIQPLITKAIESIFTDQELEAMKQKAGLQRAAQFLSKVLEDEGPKK